MNRIAYLLLFLSALHGQVFTDIRVDRRALFNGTVDMGGAVFQFPRVEINPSGACAGTQAVFSLQSGSIWVCSSGTWAQMGSGSGGASLPSQSGNAGRFLTTDGTTASWGVVSGGGGFGDLAVTRSSATVEAVATGKIRFPGTTFDLPAATATITAGTGSGAVQWYVTAAGVIVVEHATAAGLSITCSNCTASQVASPSVPDGAYHLASTTVASGAWSTTITDRRASLNAPDSLAAGTGIIVSRAGGVVTTAIDTTDVPRLGAANVFTGTMDMSGASGVLVRRGSGPPSAGSCDVAEEVGGVYQDTTVGGVLHRCAQTSSGVWGWVPDAAGTASGLAFTRTSATVMSFTAGSATVNSTPTSLPSGTITVTAAAGGPHTVLVYVTSAGVLTVESVPGVTFTCVNCSIATPEAVPALPVNAVPVAALTVSAGAWGTTIVRQVGTVMTSAISPGSGLAEGTPVGGARVFNVDSSAVAFLGGTNVFTGSVSAAGATATAPASTGTLAARPTTCILGQMYNQTDGATGLYRHVGAAGACSWSPVGATDIVSDAIGTATTPALTLRNTTAAAVGAQQFSPALVLGGNGWRTNATAASQTAEVAQVAFPVQGAAAPTVGLMFLSRIAGGSWSNAAAAPTLFPVCSTVSACISLGGTNAGATYGFGSGAAGQFNWVSGGADVFQMNALGITMGNARTLGWSVNAAAGATATQDTAIRRMAAGSLAIDNGTSGTFRDLAVRALTLSTADARPSCDVTQRGKLYATQGGAGVADSVAVCAKDAADAYAWRVIY